MRICILETGAPPPPLDGQYSSYPAMFEQLLAPLDPRLSFTAVPVHQGAMAPPLDAFDGLLITGSPAGVYENHPWIAPAEALIRAAAKARKPQIGVCFGHQLMAQAFGGVVEKSPRGWGVGVHRYIMNGAADWMTPTAGEIACAVSHQDQVITPPPEARTLGGSSFCPHGVIDYAQGPALSFQVHPEFTGDYGAALLRLRAGRIPADRVEAGLSSYKNKSDRVLIGRWMANFFTQKRS